MEHQESAGEEKDAVSCKNIESLCHCVVRASAGFVSLVLDKPVSPRTGKQRHKGCELNIQKVIENIMDLW